MITGADANDDRAEFVSGDLLVEHVEAGDRRLLRWYPGRLVRPTWYVPLLILLTVLLMPNTRANSQFRYR